MPPYQLMHRVGFAPWERPPDAWEVRDVQDVADDAMPPPIRRARPTMYHLARAA
jgi:hypothetical protein